MYTVENVKKFFSDQFLYGNWIIKQEVAQAVVKRAEEDADEYGILNSGGMHSIFGGEEELVAAFRVVIGRRAHQIIASAALRLREEAQAA